MKLLLTVLACIIATAPFIPFIANKEARGILLDIIKTALLAFLWLASVVYLFRNYVF